MLDPRAALGFASTEPVSASNVTAAGTISAALVAALSGGLGLPTQPVAGTSGATQTAPLPGAINVSTPTVPQGPPLQISPPLVSEPSVGTGSSTAQPIAVGPRLLKPIVDPLVSEQKPGDVKPGSTSSAIDKAAGALSGVPAPNAGVLVGAPNLNLPTSGLYTRHDGADQPYLITTNGAFGQGAPSSTQLLTTPGTDPAKVGKLLGDGFY